MGPLLNLAMVKTSNEEITPCNNVCRLDDHNVCISCHRTLQEISNWSDYSIEELRKLILSEEKKILQGAGWKGAIVAVGAMFGITNF